MVRWILRLLHAAPLGGGWIVHNSDVVAGKPNQQRGQNVTMISEGRWHAGGHLLSPLLNRADLTHNKSQKHAEALHVKLRKLIRSSP